MDNDDSAGDELTLDHMQTMPIRYDSTSGQYRLSVTETLHAADLDSKGAVRYAPKDVETFGVLLGFGVEKEKSTETNTYNILPRGESGNAYQLEIPKSVLDALYIDSENEIVQTDTPPLLDVYAGEGVIAFDRAASLPIPRDVLSTATGRDAGELTLETTQTTTPRSYGKAPTTGITPAFNRAGGDLEAVEFLPDLAGELDDVVPAVARGDTTGRDTVRSVYRQGPDNHGAAVSLPDDVLAALDLSTADFEDVPRSACPSLVVYAGEGAIGFGRPGRRTITLD